MTKKKQVLRYAQDDKEGVFVVTIVPQVGAQGQARTWDTASVGMMMEVQQYAVHHEAGDEPESVFQDASESGSHAFQYNREVKRVRGTG
jgi:hypothetical protein